MYLQFFGRRGAVIATLLLTLLSADAGRAGGVAGAHAMNTSPTVGKLVIHIAVTGGLHYTGTVSGGVVNDTFYSNFCEARRKSHSYIVYYANQATGPNSFRLIIAGYQPSVSHYRDPRSVTLEVGIALLQHDLNGRGTVQLTAGGLRGTVTANHLRAEPAVHTPISVQASWTCPRLFVSTQK